MKFIDYIESYKNDYLLWLGTTLEQVKARNIDQLK